MDLEVVIAERAVQPFDFDVVGPAARDAQGGPHGYLVNGAPGNVAQRPAPSALYSQGPIAVELVHRHAGRGGLGFDGEVAAEAVRRGGERRGPGNPRARPLGRAELKDRLEIDAAVGAAHLAEQSSLAQRHGLGEEFRQIEHAVGARDLEVQGVHHTIHGERGGERTVERYGKPGERLERRHQ